MENSISNRKEIIKDFLNKLRQSEGGLPKFCHNSKVKNKVLYSGPFFDDNELIAAIDALLFGKWSSSGEICSQFEREFSKVVKEKFSFFTNSGSSANLLLIAACKEYFKWGDGDEIIVSAVAFPTTISVIVQNNLKPVFIDIEWDTLNFDQKIIAEKITPKTKAIFLSPVLGNPPDMDFLINLCKKNNIELILDNCDSLGSQWKGKLLNKYAAASSCSFYPAHEITTLEGGMVSSNIEEIVKMARSYGTWGRDCFCVGANNLLQNGTCNKRFSNWLPAFPNKIVDHRYIFNRIGYNLKPLDLQGAIGLEQLKKLDTIYTLRRDRQNRIQAIFQNFVKGVRFPKVFEESLWVPFGTPIICSDNKQKQKLVNYLEANGIQTRNYFAGNILIHRGYRHLDDYLKYPNANKVLELVFFIGCSPTISEDNITYIAEVLSHYEN